MTTPENAHPKRKLKFSHIVIIAFFILVVVAMNSGGSSSTTASAPKVDVGTSMACEHWRINLSNASVETTAQQIAGAQKVWGYAKVSEIPEIVSNAKAMTEAMISQDSQAYLKYATAFGNACVAAGQ